MDKKRKPMKISNRLLLAIGTIFVLAGIVVVVLINKNARQQALFEAEKKARIILDRNLATHTYFTHKLKPTLFKFTEPIRSEAYFEPIGIDRVSPVHLSIAKHCCQQWRSGILLPREKAVFFSL